MLGNCCDRPEVVEPFQTLALVMDKLDAARTSDTDLGGHPPLRLFCPAARASP
jgi:hypothetical protein